MDSGKYCEGKIQGLNNQGKAFLRIFEAIFEEIHKTKVKEGSGLQVESNFRPTALGESWALKEEPA